jgi:hypothetical protein
LKIHGNVRESRCTTGINDTGGQFATGVNNTSGKIAAGINDTGGKFATTSVADPGCLSRIPDPTFFHPGSRILDPGSLIPDPNCLHPGSRILIKEFKYFNPQKSKKMISKL